MQIKLFPAQIVAMHSNTQSSSGGTLTAFNCGICCRGCSRRINFSQVLTMLTSPFKEMQTKSSNVSQIVSVIVFRRCGGQCHRVPAVLFAVVCDVCFFQSVFVKLRHLWRILLTWCSVLQTTLRGSGVCICQCMLRISTIPPIGLRRHGSVRFEWT